MAGGFLDKIKGFLGTAGLDSVGGWLDKGSGLLGAGGNAAMLAADFIEDDQKSGNAAIAGGSMNLVSSLAGTAKSGMDLAKPDAYDPNETNLSEEEWKKNRKGSAISGLISGGSGILGSIADIVGGAAKKSGNKSLEKGAGWASNILGLIGSGAGMAQGVMDLKAAKDGKAKAAAINGIAGNALGGLGGILGTVGMGLEAGGKEKAGDITSKVGSVIGNGGGALSNLIGMFLG